MKDGRSSLLLIGILGEPDAVWKDDSMALLGRRLAPPKYPTLFVRRDHLGSTVLLTCCQQPAGQSCANGAVYRYLRYDAYRRMVAYGAFSDVFGSRAAGGGGLKVPNIHRRLPICRGNPLTAIDADE